MQVEELMAKGYELLVVYGIKFVLATGDPYFHHW